MLTAVRLLELHDLNDGNKNSRNEELAAFLVGISSDLKELSQHITGHYLTRVQTTPHFAMIPGDRK